MLVVVAPEIVLIRVDLGVHLDFDEFRCFPGHDNFLGDYWKIQRKP
jgi:hypothetical protein